MTTTILIVTFLVCVILAAANNFAQIQLRDKESVRGQNLWHITNALTRGVITFVFAYLVEDQMNDIVAMWILVQLWWWLLFDSVLNLFRSRHVFYVGYTDIIDMLIRTTAMKLNLKPELVGVSLKLLLITIVLIVYLF